MEKVWIRGVYVGWHEVDRGKAAGYVRRRMDGMTAIPREKRAEHVDGRYLRGCTVAELLAD